VGLFSRRKRFLGLDIGYSSVKAIELYKTGSTYEIVNFAVVPIPRRVPDGERVNTVALKSALGEKLIMPKKGDLLKAISAVASDKVLIRHITLPAMPEKELTEAVRFESEVQFPIPAKDLLVDFVKIRDFVENGVKKQEVMLVAAKRSHVKELADLITYLGLEPETIDIEPLALARVAALFFEPSVEKKQSYAVVDFGSASTGISVFIDNILRFTRVLPVGGQKITDVLTSCCNMTTEEAEAAKKSLDLTSEFLQLQLPGLFDKVEAIKSVVGEMVNEIRRTIDFYMTQRKDINLEKVFLTGGGAPLRGLDAMFSDGLGIPVIIMNPLEKLKLADKLRYREHELKEAGTALAVAVGLAIK